MLIVYQEFAARADAILAHIAAACARAGRAPSTVELLAVTKTHPAAVAASRSHSRQRGPAAVCGVIAFTSESMSCR